MSLIPFAPFASSFLISMYPEYRNITERIPNPLSAQTTGLCSNPIGGLLERHVAIVVAMHEQNR